ncbi:MAG: beta-propeller fold lactonase family protein [Chloroflexi bacterium]|nr:beta-propeller fold lactonase family protein [Chloroflexota bacterium]
MKTCCIDRIPGGIFALCFLLFLLTSCAPSLHPPQKTIAKFAGQPLLTVYVTTSGSSLADFSFVLQDIALFSDGIWLDLDLPPQQIDRLGNKGQQLLLGVTNAPLGEQRRLRFRLTAIKVAGQSLAGLPEGEFHEAVLATPVTLAEADSQCLFIDWNLDGNDLYPSFSARGQQAVLGGSLAYVLCDDIRTIYVLRTDSNEVISAFSLPGPLAEMRLDPQTRRLYVLSAGKHALYVYDCMKSRLLEQIDLPRTIAPSYLTLAEDTHLAFVSDPASSQVLRVNLLSGVVEAQQRLSQNPGKLLYFSADNGHLAVLSPATQKVFLLSPDSLQVQRVISVGMQPDSLVYFAGMLYVSEQAADKVSAYNYQTGRLVQDISVGRAPADILSEDGRRLFVSNSGGASVSVIYAGQKTSFRRIPTVDFPRDMAISAQRRLLYVAGYEKKHLTVIDLTGLTVRKQLSLGGRPLSIAILD